MVSYDELRCVLSEKGGSWTYVSLERFGLVNREEEHDGFAFSKGLREEGAVFGLCYP